MRKTLIMALVFGLGVAHAEQSKRGDPEVGEVAKRAIDKHSLTAGELREHVCGGAG